MGSKAKIPPDLAADIPARLPGLYLHVPFCARKCPYCDFYSTCRTPLTADWIAALEREIFLWAGRFDRFDTVYLGGGTPSVLGEQDLEAVFDALGRGFAIAEGAEITIEANPGDLTRPKARLLRDLGVNRLSLGVQSFQDPNLERLGRRHTARQARQAIGVARSAGFENLGIDLIYGVPGQALSGWIADLEAALELSPEHLACYQLTFKDHTPFGRDRASGRIAELSEPDLAAFFLAASELLTGHGYLHYEVSNFARGPAWLSKHNQKYWHHVPYLGLGPSAHSFAERRRWWNHASLERYVDLLSAGRSPVAGEEVLTGSELRLEALMLGFRTREGVDLASLGAADRIRTILEQMVASGLAVVQGDRAIPTPQGLLVADRLPLLFA